MRFCAQQRKSSVVEAMFWESGESCEQLFKETLAIAQKSY